MRETATKTIAVVRVCRRATDRAAGIFLLQRPPWLELSCCILMTSLDTQRRVQWKKLILWSGVLHNNQSRSGTSVTDYGLCPSLRARTDGAVGELNSHFI